MADVRWREQSATDRVLLSALELLAGPADPGWQISSVGNNLPQLQHC